METECTREVKVSFSPNTSDKVPKYSHNTLHFLRLKFHSRSQKMQRNRLPDEFWISCCHQCTSSNITWLYLWLFSLPLSLFVLSVGSMFAMITYYSTKKVLWTWLLLIYLDKIYMLCSSLVAQPLHWLLSMLELHHVRFHITYAVRRGLCVSHSSVWKHCLH